MKMTITTRAMVKFSVTDAPPPSADRLRAVAQHLDLDRLRDRRLQPRQAAP